MGTSDSLTNSADNEAVEESLTRRAQVRRINHAMDYLDAYMAEPLDVAALARQAHFSPRRFADVFLEVTGETPGDFQRRVRLERAAALLNLYQDVPVLDIALRVGYQSAAVFARAFRTHFGRSAQEWRRGDFWRHCGLVTCWRPLPCHECEPLIEELCQYERPQTEYNGKGRWEVLDAPPNTVSNVKVETLPPRRIAYIRAQGKYQATIVPLIRRMAKWAAVNNMLAPDTMFISNIVDIPCFTAPRQMRYDAGIVVPPDFVADRYVNVREIPGGPHVTARFTGRFVDDSFARRYLWNYWMPEHECLPIGKAAYDIGPAAYLTNSVFQWNSVVSFSICIPVLGRRGRYMQLENNS